VTFRNIVHELRERGVRLKATEQPIDTSSAAGKAFLDIYEAGRRTLTRGSAMYGGKPPKRAAEDLGARRAPQLCSLGHLLG